MIDAVRRTPPGALFVVLTLVAAFALPAAARAQGVPVAGQNVNMVSGTEWPGGDPFLQRDNEPGMAISSLNIERLLAGANTYRTVDLPFPAGGDSETGDAWLGVYKSFDGGRTWKTYLLPGYPQDTSPEGAASPLKKRGLRAAADATVRAGTNGFFGMSGIAFNRDTNDGVVFFSRHIDLDMKENGDAAKGLDSIPYVDTVLVDTGNAGQFLDKPWFVVDIPRSFAQGTCSISTSISRKNGDTVETVPVSRSFPVGPMYIAWSRFTGSQSTKIMVSRSLDCGKTWQTATKVSEGNSINQGTALAIDPQTGALYVAWRRFKTSSQTDAILVARSTDGGQTFPSKDTKEIASFIPFDQGTTGYSFRTNALPTIAASVSGTTSRVHVAWAQRGATAGESRIVVSTSSNGGASWSAPSLVDAGAAVDERGVAYTTDDGQALDRGHQFMPQITFSGGKLMVLYYDLRLDHTTGSYAPKTPFQADASGSFYDETREKRGELVTDPDVVHKPYVSDAPPTSTDTGLTIRRHTLDLRAAQASPAATLSWRSSPVSRFPFGTRGDETGTIAALTQLRVNPPNLPLFQQGTVPFIGDYIDIVGEAFYAADTAPGKPWCYGVWCYRVEQQVSPVHYATWTSNEDVRPPADGDWTHYTPVGPGGPSIYDPTKQRPDCVAGQGGMRNQNVYVSRITQGLLVSSPQAAKPLSLAHESAFVVLVNNQTALSKTYRLSIASQPAGGRASFLAATSSDDPTKCYVSSAASDGGPLLCTAIDVAIPPRSGIARSVFAKSNAPGAKLTVNVNEIGGPGGSLVSNGLSGFVLLNAVAVAQLASPDDAGNVSGGEVYDPAISLINVSNPNVSNVNVSNPNVSNVNVSNVNVSNPNVSNVNVSNADIADINISNVNVSNPNVSNVNVSNVNISNVNISNTTITDANYAITNEGNTTHSYHVKLVGEPTGTPIQLILTKPYATPTAVTCDLAVESHDATLASIPTPEVEPASEIGNPDIPDSSQANATLSLAPGETAVVTIRGRTDLAGMHQVTSQLTPAIVAHGYDSQGNLHPFATLLLVTTSNATLPVATVGVPYGPVTLTSLGGAAPITWSVSSGQLPPGVDLTGNTVSGTPTAAGSYTAEITATDSANPSQTATKSLTFTVNARSTAATLTLSPASVAAGASSLATVVVTDTTAAGTRSNPAGDVSIGGTGVAGSTCTLVGVVGGSDSSSCSLGLYSALPGSYTVTASYPGSAVHAPATASAGLVVLKGTTTTTITSDSPDPSTTRDAVTVTVAVAAASSLVGTPAGTVAVDDLAGTTCTITLPATSCSLTSTTAGTRTWTATYSGDTLFAGSQGSASHTVNQPPAYQFTGFLSPLATALPYPSASLSGSWTASRVLPLKWQLKDASGNAVTSASAVAAILALNSGSGACQSGPAPALPSKPYVNIPGSVAVLYTPASGAAGGSDFRPGTTYNFNWDATKNASKGCWSIVLQLDDGRAWATKVQLK
jgi:uncharacterized protein YjbI with pentapeptide repeats